MSGLASLIHVSRHLTCLSRFFLKTFMKCFFVYLFQDDHGLKRKITFLKQVLAVQNEVSVYEIRVSLFKRENECFLLLLS